MSYVSSVWHSFAPWAFTHLSKDVRTGGKWMKTAVKCSLFTVKTPFFSPAMFDYSYQYFLSYIISVSTNRCKVACCENVRTGAWWCLFPLPAWPLTAIETSCVKQSLLSLICKVLPFASALKNTPFSTVWNSALSLLPSVFDYSYYRKLLLLARSGIFVCVVRMHACTCVCVCIFL